jgi:hypothetical protein
VSARGTTWTARSPLTPRRRVASVRRLRGASRVRGSALACSLLRSPWRPP